MLTCDVHEYTAIDEVQNGHGPIATENTNREDPVEIAHSVEIEG